MTKAHDTTEERSVAMQTIRRIDLPMRALAVVAYKSGITEIGLAEIDLLGSVRWDDKPRLCLSTQGIKGSVTRLRNRQATEPIVIVLAQKKYSVTDTLLTPALDMIDLENKTADERRQARRRHVPA